MRKLYSSYDPYASPLSDSPYLEPNPNLTQKGYVIGKLPSKIELKTLRALGHAQSPIKAIRAKCIDCCGGSPSEVRKCTAVNCPLWAMRMGKNPFYGHGGAHG